MRTSIRRGPGSLGLAGIGILLTSTAWAQGPLVTGKTWQMFQWSRTSPTVTYTLDLSGVSTATELNITDAYTAGDVFRVTITCTTCSPASALTLRTSPSRSYADAPQTWGDASAAWDLDHFHSRLVVWLEGSRVYTVQIGLAQQATDPDDGTLMDYGAGFIRAVVNNPSVFVELSNEGPTAAAASGAAEGKAIEVREAKKLKNCANGPMHPNKGCRY